MQIGVQHMTNEEGRHIFDTRLVHIRETYTLPKSFLTIVFSKEMAVYHKSVEYFYAMENILWVSFVFVVYNQNYLFTNKVVVDPPSISIKQETPRH